MKHINAWVFDLDQTLYAKSTKLEDAVVQKIREVVANRLGISLDEAQAKTVEYYKQYGATVLGLKLHDGIEPASFLADVYEGLDLSIVPQPHKLIREMLKMLPGRKVLFTNGSRHHAERVLKHMGLYDIFDTIVDVSVADYRPKPMREPFDAFFAQTGIDPTRAAFFEDSVRNLEMGKSYGMTTFLVDEYGDTYQNQPFIDYVERDVFSLLTKVLGHL